MTPSTNRRTDTWALWKATVAAAVPVVAAAVIGNRATLPAIAPWYDGLVKPAFNPPDWVFGPVWTLLYLTMIVAFARILRKDRETPGRTTAIVLFLVQIAANAAWSVVFFGLRSPGGGLAVIGVLWIALALTTWAFGRLDRPAGLWLVPCLCWVSFAAVLDAAVWRLNG